MCFSYQPQRATRSPCSVSLKLLLWMLFSNVVYIECGVGCVGGVVSCHQSAEHLNSFLNFCCIISVNSVHGLCWDTIRIQTRTNTQLMQMLTLPWPHLEALGVFRSHQDTDHFLISGVNGVYVYVINEVTESSSGTQIMYCHAYPTHSPHIIHIFLLDCSTCHSPENYAVTRCYCCCGSYFTSSTSSTPASTCRLSVCCVPL